MDRDFFRHHVTGAVASINTPFLRDGAVDYAGLGRFIEFTLDAGAKSVLFTPGDSLYTVLTEADVAELTRFTAATVGDRAMFIAAADCWWTGKTVEFAQYARDVGAKAIILFPPNRDMALTELVEYYRVVSAELPVFALSGSLGVLGVSKALDAVGMLLETVPGVVGLKEDYCPEFARQACLLAHDKWAIFAGGQKQTHMDMLPYGCDGYMSTFIKFRPAIARTYRDAVEAGDMPLAVSVIRDYDLPLFRLLYSEFPAGGDAAQHALLELAGICGRWRRKPLPDLTDEEVECVQNFLDTELA